MKVAAVLAVVAAVVAVACGFPASDPVIDWTRAEAAANDLKTLIQTSTATVVKAASDTNTTPGNSIAEIAKETGEKIDADLNELLDGIKAKTSTNAQLAKHLAATTLSLAVSQGRIELRLWRLPEDAQESIRATLRDTDKNAAGHAKELLEAFGLIGDEELILSDPVIDWTAAEAAANNLKTLIQTSTASVVKAASETNTSPGNSIANIAKETGEKIDADLNELLEGLKAKTLTNAQLAKHLAATTLSLAVSQGRIELRLWRLPEDVQESIRATLRDTDKKAAGHAKELLEAFGIIGDEELMADPVIDWTAAETAANDLKTLIKTSTETIVKTASETGTSPGNSIANIAKETGAEIDADLTDLLDGIKAKTLTNAQLAKHLAATTLNMLIATGRIEARVWRLPEDAQNTIRATLKEADTKAAVHAKELLEAFGIIGDEELMADPVIDWTRAETAANDLKNLIKTSTETIVKTASETGTSPGNSIANIAKETGADIDDDLAELVSGIKAKTLTNAQLAKHLGETTVRLLVSQGRIEARVWRLPEAAQNTIRATLKETDTKSAGHAKELLEAFGIIGDEE